MLTGRIYKDQSPTENRRGWVSQLIGRGNLAPTMYGRACRCVVAIFPNRRKAHEIQNALNGGGAIVKYQQILANFDFLLQTTVSGRDRALAN